MRVGLDASPLALDPGRGVARGVAGWLRALDTALGPADEVVAFLPRRADRGGDDVPRALPGGRVRWVEPPRSEAWTARGMRRRLPRLLARDPVDVFLSPWSAFPALDAPVVATVHELPFLRWGPVEGRLTAWSHRRWLRRDVRECAAVLTPCAATRDDVVRLHPGAASRVHVVPHAFDPRPWRAASRARPAAAGERPRALLVGCTHRRKGLHVWRGALDSLSDLGLVWTLVGAPRSAASRRALSRRPDVEILAAADDAALAERLAGAAVLVYPSLSEGFGFPPLEAMAAGVPVVATRTGSVPEVCGEAALLVPPGDPAALAAGVRRVLTDAALRASLVAKGSGRCEAFPAEETGRRLVGVLRGAAGEGGR